MIPIIIGVTGHRNLREDAVPLLMCRVEERLRELQSMFSNSPLYLISPLAEGADRIVAKTAVSLGIQLVVPLPLPQEEYEKDFASDNSKQEFRELLRKAASIVHLPVISKEMRPLAAERDTQYAYVGAWVAHYSHLLIALWDGKDSQSVGGTAQVVHYKLYGSSFHMKKIDELFASHSKFYSTELGLVLHLMSPRVNDHSINSEDIIWNELYYSSVNGCGSSELEWASLKKIEETNVRILATQSSNADTFTGLVNNGLFSPEIQIPENWGMKVKHMADVYLFADACSLAHQHNWRWGNVWFFSTVASAVLTFNIYTNVWEKWQVLFAYLLLFGIANLLYFRLQRARKTEENWYDHRILAESLRIQIYWLFAGIRTPISNYLLRRQRELNWWTHKAVVALHFTSQIVGDCETLSAATRQTMLQYWIDGQSRYFSRKQAEASHRLKNIKKWRNILFLLGALVTMALLCIDVFTHWNIYPIWVQFLVVVASLAPAYAGTLAILSSANLMDYQVEQYSSMARLFGQAEKALQQIGTIDNDERLWREILSDLGQAALQETGDWLITQYDRRTEAWRG